jgi:hypothetical protein
MPSELHRWTLDQVALHRDRFLHRDEQMKRAG